MLGILGKTEDLIAFLNKKKTSLSVFFFILLGFLAPITCSAASWVETLSKAPGRYLLFLSTKFAVNIAQFFTKWAGSLLNWILSPGFIKLSYTNPANNPIIKTGLNVTRGFVNMILVLILVYIAIATILRLSGYETKKLLITFLAVALLVNFSPVFCGLIVDSSNIVMNFFVKDLKADTFGNTMAMKIGEISEGFTDSIDLDKGGWDYITQLAVMVPFLWVLTFILLLFSVLFILRFLVIWLLVILSPLAFAAYILPSTRKYFDEWWKQFINWSIIGITCGFFLYLGLLLVFYVPSSISTPETPGNGVFDAILPFFVSIIFLGLGFVVGLKTSAMGANTIMNTSKSWAKRGVKTGAKWTKQGAWAGTKAGGRKIGRTVRDRMAESEGIQKFAQRMATSKRLGEGQKGVLGAIKRTIDIPYYTKRALGKVTGANFPDQQKDSIKKKQEDLKNKDKNTVLKEFHAAGTAGNKTDRVATLNAAIEAGDIDDLMDVKKYGNNAITKEDIEQTFKFAKNIGADKTIKNAFAGMAAKDVSSEKLATAKIKNPKVNNRMKVVVSGMKQKDYENTSKENLKNKEFMAAVLEFADGKSIEKLIEKHGNEAITELNKTIKSRSDAATKLQGGKLITPAEYLEKANPKLHKYLKRNPGTAFFDI